MQTPEHSPLLNAEIGENLARPIVVSADVGLRHEIIADALDIPLDRAEAQHWYQRKTREFARIIGDGLKGPTVFLDAYETAVMTRARLELFRENARRANEVPVVISLDPLIADHIVADYIFQETRASLVRPGQPRINLEHSPRGHTNRFFKPAHQYDGAGKSLDEQAADVESLITTKAGNKKARIALVDDCVSSGNALAQRFGTMFDREHGRVTVMAGLMSNEGAARLQGLNVATESIYSLASKPSKYMDLTDFLPTLGGRVIGWQRGTESPKLRVAGPAGQQVPMAVDAILGRYPWQVDIYLDDITPRLMESLQEFSLVTAWEFWASLEAYAHKELSWKDLQALNGRMRVFYPVKDLESSQIPVADLRSGPRKAIEAIMTKELQL